MTSHPLPEYDDVNLYFRPLQEGDHYQIKILHEELFPVRYSADFYENVVRNKTTGGCPLLSRVAVVKGLDEECCSSLDPQHDNFMELSHYIDVPFLEECGLENLLTIPAQGETKADDILGCIIGAFVKNSRDDGEDNMSSKLIRDPLRHTNLFYIMTLGATGAYRKQGLGTKLIEDCLSIVEQVPSCGGLYLHVITYNTAAINFYERRGFYRIEEIKGM